jgi:RND superfamily putative drug exporter
MLKRFARLATTRPRAVLAAAAVLFVVSVGVGGGVGPLLTSGGFEDPASESSRADAVLAHRFGTGVPNLVLLVTASKGNVDDPVVTRAGRALTARLARERDLTNVVSYWSEGGAAPLRSGDGHRALVVGRIAADDRHAADRAGELAPRYRTPAGDRNGPVTVQVGGFAEQFHEVGTTLNADLPRAELIALPIVLVLLAFVFRGVLAALLPLAIGVLSIVGTLLVLRITVAITDVSVFALNLTTALGLGLAIDYSLFMVSRFREELSAGHEPRAAVSRTVSTAGRTVAFSALTVAASLAATLLCPVVVLRSFAYAGVAVALFAGLLSVLVLPAILALLGPRVNALAVRRRRAPGPPEEGRWYRVATFVMRRPVPIATGLIAVLLVLASPFQGLRLSQADDRVLPNSASSRQVGDAVRTEFSSQEPAALSVVAPGAGGGAAPEVNARIAAYAARLATLPNVARVDAATGTYCGEASAAAGLGCKPGRLVVGPGALPRYARYRAGRATYLSVVPAVEPFSRAGEQLVADVRDTSTPFTALVTGRSASLVDTKDALFTRLPFALTFIAVVTFGLLFMTFGSVVLPVKALVLNLLSLSATFGALVWIFQDGHLAGLLGITTTGGLDPVIPILMFCIAYGLSMDYEVFLLSRIQEEHDRGARNERAVALGLARTGPIVTAAALIMAVVFLAVGTSRVSFITMFGLGLALAVLLDAFVMRGVLVPAFMRLAGDWNWWAPRRARRFHDRYGISESADLGATPSSTRPANRRTPQRPRGPAA